MKALLSDKKARREQGLFVAEGIQSVREALKINGAVVTLYLTNSGGERLQKAGVDYSVTPTIEISDKVSEAMSDAITGQGIFAICKIPDSSADDLAKLQNSHLIFLQEIQDPGNAGTILRTADAMGISAIVTSPGSVDFYSPKVVRATAGSLWHLSVFSGKELDEVRKYLPNHHIYILDSAATISFTEVDLAKPAIWIFGNEARGFEAEVADATPVCIRMPGRAESLNLAAAAAIVMHEISRK